VLDYIKKGFADDGKKYDIILDAVGKRTFFSFLRSLTETGVYITENAYVLRHKT
jgi:NADPH:quinone reductase-like Zn-dependent oxidoreductase